VAAGKLRDRIPKELKSRNVNIDTAYNDLVAVILWIDERGHEVDIAGDERSLIAGGCFDMVLEHQNAVARLVENQLYGSALAQLRLIADAHIRGMWFARCATEADAARFRETDYTKKLNDLIKENPDLKDLVSNLTLLAGGLLAVTFDGDNVRRIHRAHHIKVLPLPAQFHKLLGNGSKAHDKLLFEKLAVSHHPISSDPMRGYTSKRKGWTNAPISSCVAAGPPIP